MHSKKMFNMYLHIHSISKNPSNTRTLQFICYLCIYPKHEEKLVHQAELLIGRLGPSINGEIKWQSQYLKWLVTFHQMFQNMHTYQVLHKNTFITQKQGQWGQNVGHLMHTHTHKQTMEGRSISNFYCNRSKFILFTTRPSNY